MSNNAYCNKENIPDIYAYSQNLNGTKAVTLDVAEYNGYEWMIVHRYRDGDVLGIKLPCTGSPMSEPLPWVQLRFKPE